MSIPVLPSSAFVAFCTRLYVFGVGAFGCSTRNDSMTSPNSAIFSARSIVSSSGPYPLHLTKYHSPFLVRFQEIIFSTSYSSSPSSVMTGGGATCRRWKSSSARKGRSKFTWNTSCMRIDLGKASLYVWDEIFSAIANGPIFFASSFLEGRLVLIFGVARYTLSPTLYMTRGVDSADRLYCMDAFVSSHMRSM